MHPPFVEEALASLGGPSSGMAVGLEMAGGTDGWGEGARNSLSPAKGPWVFTALGMICELIPPYFLTSKHLQLQQPQHSAPESFSFHVTA